MDEREAPWKDDERLQESLENYVRQGLQRREMLDFISRDFEEYTWSLRSLDRRLRHFNIYYNCEDIPDAEVKSAVEKELEGPGKLLGYRSMHKKVRQEHGLNVSRDKVYACMKELDPTGLETRGGVGGKRRRQKGHFTTKGPNWVHSLDGHDKLMGYQNSTFPLAIYGCIDTASRKLLWLKVWITNSDPKIIGKWYLDYLFETKLMSAMLRLDKGTETGIMASMHSFLRRNNDDDMDPHETVIYGPSTSNQIERWWRELHERMEKYFKVHLSWLKNNGHYDPHNETDRMLLAFVMIPLVQKELDIFRETVWNTHRIRAQKDAVLPNGIPNHIYSFPRRYHLEECGFQVTEKQLQEVATHSGVLEVPDDFLEPDFRAECERLIPDHDTIKPHEFKDAYMYLKNHFNYSV